MALSDLAKYSTTRRGAVSLRQLSYLLLRFEQKFLSCMLLPVCVNVYACLD